MLCGIRLRYILCMLQHLGGRGAFFPDTMYIIIRRECEMWKQVDWWYVDKYCQRTSSLAFCSFAVLTWCCNCSCWRFIFAIPASSSWTLPANHITVDIITATNHDMALIIVLQSKQPITRVCPTSSWYTSLNCVMWTGHIKQKLCWHQQEE